MLLSFCSHWFHLKVLNHERNTSIHIYACTNVHKNLRHFFYDVKCRLSVVPFEKLRAMGIKSYIMFLYMYIIFHPFSYSLRCRCCCYGQIKAFAYSTLFMLEVSIGIKLGTFSEGNWRNFSIFDSKDRHFVNSRLWFLEIDEIIIVNANIWMVF